MNAFTNGLLFGLVTCTFVMCISINKEVKGIRKDIEKIHQVTLNEDGTVTLSDGTLCIYNQKSNLWFRASSNLNTKQEPSTNK